MIEVKKEKRMTITSIFMVATLKIPGDKLRENNFLNAYSKDDMREVQYKDAIYLLFKPDDLDKFRYFLDGEYERTKQIIDDYDYPNGFVVVVYKLNMNFSDDFNLVRQGKYSKTSKLFQSQFPRTLTININGMDREEVSLQYRVFNKTKDLIRFWEEKFDVTLDKDQEIWYCFNEDDETLTKEILKEYE